jgi:hypothetical protein
MAFWHRWRFKEEGTTVINKGGGCGGFYFLAGVGVFFYYFPTIHTFTELIIVFVKSVFWPAFLSFKLYTLLGMH